MEDTKNYINPDCLRFVQDMEDAGLDVYHYRGRNFWEGPAVTVDSTYEAQENTRVRLQHDGMGLGYVVYPVARDKGEATVEESLAAAGKMHSQRVRDTIAEFLDATYDWALPDVASKHLAAAADLLAEVLDELQ